MISNFPLHMEEITALSPKYWQVPTGQQDFFYFFSMKGFMGLVFLSPNPLIRLGKQQPNQVLQFFHTYCSSRGVQTIYHSVSAACSVTVIRQRWLIVGCHPSSLQQHIIIHVGKNLKPGERSCHFSLERVNTQPLKGCIWIHVYSWYLLSMLLCHSIFNIKSDQSYDYYLL